MSNKIVSATYRTIIDDVIQNVRQDFEEMGIEKEVLEELQRSWETRLVATGVSDFDDSVPVPNKPTKKESKTEAAAAAADASTSEDKKSGVAGGADDPSGDPSAPSGSNKAAKTQESSDATGGRLDDREARDEDDEDDGASSSAKAGSKRKQPEKNSDEIGSDLDDSDDDLDGDGNENGLDADTILCLYDKVQRVKNKWKCVLRDGVANIDGKDYLFSRCNTEFEW